METLLNNQLVIMTKEDFDSFWSTMESHIVQAVSRVVNLSLGEETAASA